MRTAVRLSLLHIDMVDQETAGNTRPTLLIPLRSNGHMVGASTEIVNTGTLPTLTFGPYECDTWPIANNTMGQSGFMRKYFFTNTA